MHFRSFLSTVMSDSFTERWLFMTAYLWHHPQGILKSQARDRLSCVSFWVSMLKISTQNFDSKISAQNFSSKFQLRISGWIFWAEIFSLKIQLQKQAEIFSLFFASWNSESKFRLLAENFDSKWNFDSQMNRPCQKQMTQTLIEFCRKPTF